MGEGGGGSAYKQRGHMPKEAKSGCIFLLTGRWAYNWRGSGGGGGGGSFPLEVNFILR